ncbi:MAG: hypothetical protein JWP32_2496 [Schumannella sp.]|nr:hypothetical protein [Schumannella sp.]
MSAHTPDAGPTPWSRVVAIPVALTLAVSVILLAFLWPALTSAPHDLPLAAAGPTGQLDQLLAGIDQNAPGVFDVTTVDDRAAAVDAIEHRDVYAAIVLGQQPEVLTSSAASPVAAQALSGVAAQLQGQLQQAAAAQAAAAGIAPPTITVAVTDVVPLAGTDERGVGLASAVLPLVIGGLLGGILTTLAVSGRLRRLVAIALYSVFAGAAVAGILQGWLGVLQGSYLANASAIALAMFAIGATVAGLASVLGRPGLAVGAVTFVLFAVPLASAATPVEFLPAPWGAVGQWFPPGAAASLLRELSYFPAADTVFPWLVLAGWAVAAGALVLIGRRLDRAPASTEVAAA